MQTRRGQRKKMEKSCGTRKRWCRVKNTKREHTSTKRKHTNTEHRAHEHADAEHRTHEHMNPSTQKPNNEHTNMGTPNTEHWTMKSGKEKKWKERTKEEPLTRKAQEKEKFLPKNLRLNESKKTKKKQMSPALYTSYKNWMTLSTRPFNFINSLIGLYSYTYIFCSLSFLSRATPSFSYFSPTHSLHLLYHFHLACFPLSTCYIMTT